MIFDHFDRIRVVNLPRRTDRRRQMTRELAPFGLPRDPRFAFYPGIEIPERGPFLRAGSHGNFIAHRRLLEDAARERQSILILEDDCTFLPAIRSYEPPPFDIFYGGYHASDPGDPAKGNIVGSHCMGLSARAVARAAKYLFDYVADPEFAADPQAVAAPGYDPAVRPPIDGAFVWFRRANPDLTTVFAHLSEQRPSRTDVGAQKWFDKAPILRDVAGVLRQARGA